MSGDSERRGSGIPVFPGDVAPIGGEPVVVDLGQDSGDQPEQGVAAREHADLDGAPLDLLLDGTLDQTELFDPCSPRLSAAISNPHPFVRPLRD